MFARRNQSGGAHGVSVSRWQRLAVGLSWWRSMQERSRTGLKTLLDLAFAVLVKNRD